MYIADDEGRDDAEYLVLTLEPCSELAVDVIQTISDVLWGERTAKQSKAFVTAVSALVGGLLRNESRIPEGWSYRKMSRDSFTGEPVGYRGFKQAFDRLMAAGYLESRRGTGGGNEIGIATRFRPTASHLRLLTEAGMHLGNWREHFRMLPRPASISRPIVLKSSSETEYGKKRRGQSIKVDLSRSPARELGIQVNDLNAFFAGIDIQPDDEHHAFLRLFNQGDLPTFAWNKGGRLYSAGGGYQTLSAEDRGKITLNGQAVVEIDIRASHLTILHAKLRFPFDPAGRDPYGIEGLPRDIVKAWVTMTLGYDKFQTRWSKANKDKYRDEYRRDLQADYPIGDVRRKALEALEVLRDWVDCPVRWGDLQYLESCAIVDAVYTLAMEHGVPALPVHDSIIAPRSAYDLAARVLKASFRRYMGVEPALSTKAKS
jgi:hypothetical protein